MGSYVAREFKSGIYTGKVVGLTHAYGRRLFTVIYSDVDTEDIGEDEVQEHSPLCAPNRKEELKIELAVNRWLDHRRVYAGVKVEFFW